MSSSLDQKSATSTFPSNPSPPSSSSSSVKRERSTNNSLGLDPKVFNLLKFLIFTISLPIVAIVLAYRQCEKFGLMAHLREKGIFGGSTLEVLGLITAITALYKGGLFIYRGFIVPARKPETYGKWAIVTGSTGGIGEAFVNDLARRKMSLLLVSRDVKKLEAQKAELMAKYSLSDGQVKFLVFDFTERSSEKKAAFYSELNSVCEGLDKDGGIGILVNNVGIANPNGDIPMFLEEFTTAQCDDIVSCNVFSVVNMSHTVLKFMKARKNGCVVNISSGSGNFPGPMIAVYSATKAFMTQFSNSMHIECWDSGVDFLVVTPFYIVSNLVKRKKGTLVIPMPEALVKGTFRQLGRGKYVWQAYGYWFHAALGYIADCYWDLYARNRRMMTDNRKRADERAKRES